MAAPTIVPNIDTHVTGRVAFVNDKGIKLDDQQNWLNVSKFAHGVVLPERGQIVRCTLDKAGFLRSVEAADGSPLAAPPRMAGGADVPSTKDRTITRLACLKAAAEFGASRADLKSGDVLLIAESWERWVNREADDTKRGTLAPAGHSPVLTDAF